MRSSLHSQLGFLLPAAIFLLVILAGLGAYAMNLNSVQQQTGTQDIQSTRVYHRARGIMEYAIYQILSPSSAPSCPSINNLSVNNLDSLSTSTINITCTSQDISEQGGDNTFRIYKIESKVSTGTLNQPNFIERQIDISLERAL